MTRNSGASVAEIAKRTGFCTPSHLANTFRDATGMTPREWRNGYLSNGMLTVAGLLFVVLAVKQIWDQPWSEFF